jgi:hypothetical protein
VRNAALHATLQSFVEEAAAQLNAEKASGAEVPFELVENERPRGGRTALYCYKPLTGAFIRERLGLLGALPSYAPAAQALERIEGTEDYLRRRGEPRVPSEPRERADAVLRSLLSKVFDERTDFSVESPSFEAAYVELESALYLGRSVTMVIAPVLGLALDAETEEVPLADGLSLRAGSALADAPEEAVWTFAQDQPQHAEPNVLAVLNLAHDRASGSPVSLARVRFRRILTALRLFERGGYSLGPLAWSRTDSGAWQSAPLGGSGRPRLLTFIGAEQEDELRAFCNLIWRRLPSSGGEIAWALARFEMGCERLAPFEALSDYLLALRALLEPEGPGSGRLAQRLAILCAKSEERGALAQRTAHAISLERAVIAGLAPAEPGVDALVAELAEHLRALIRDVLCSHLDSDLRAVADGLLVESSDTDPIPIG